MKPMKKNRIVFIVILAVLSCVVMWFVGRKESKTIVCDYAKIERSTLRNTITATGTVEPVSKVEVGTQVSGIVSRLYVDYNSEVRKGQVIAELDKTNLMSDLESKKSNLSSSKSDYEVELKNYERQKFLHDKKLIADVDYESALAKYKKAKSNYEVSKNEVSKAQTNLGYATIYSPIDGVVLSRSVEEGQTVASSFSTPTLFVIANDLTNMQVVADVDEADIGNVATGQKVSFTVDAFPDEEFHGIVKQVRQEPSTTNNVVTYEVIISAPNPDMKLKPGLTASVTICTMEKENVLSVPLKALKFDPTVLAGNEDQNEIVDCEGAHKLWIREGIRFVAKSVEIGITAEGRAEILSGISEGTQVVLEVKDGRDPVGKESEERKEKSPFMPSRPKKK